MGKPLTEITIEPTGRTIEVRGQGHTGTTNEGK